MSWKDQMPLVGSRIQDYQNMTAVKATQHLDVLGGVRSLEEDVYALEIEVARAEALLRGTDLPAAQPACPSPSALGERVYELRQRVQNVKMTVSRVIYELIGD